MTTPESPFPPDGGSVEDIPATRPAPRGRVRVAVALGLVLGLLVGAAFWAFGPSRDTTPAGAPARAASPTGLPGTCAWYPLDAPKPGGTVVAVGVPPASGERRRGTATLTLVTDRGPIVITMDAGRTPCTVASLAHLVAHRFFAGDTCKGDAEGVSCGQHDPDYTWADESNELYPHTLTVTSFPVTIPTADIESDICTLFPQFCKDGHPVPGDLVGSAGGIIVVPGSAMPTAIQMTVQTTSYPKGTVLVAHGDSDSNGGGLLICTRDIFSMNDRTAFGTVTSGLELLADLGTGQLTMTSATVTFG